MSKYIIVNRNLVGDALMATPGIGKFKELHPNDEVIMIAGPEPYMEIFKDSKCATQILFPTEEQFKRVESKYKRADGMWQEIDGNMVCFLNTSKSFAWATENRVLERVDGVLRASPYHMCFGFANQLGVVPSSTHYFVTLQDWEIEEGKKFVAGLEKPLIFVAAVSKSCISRSTDPRYKGMPPNMMLSPRIWEGVVRTLEDKFTFLFNHGPSEEKLDIPDTSWVSYPLRKTAAICKAAHLVVTIDTGIMHLAQAVDANILSIIAALPSTVTSCDATEGRFKCLDHSPLSRGPYGISTVTSDEIVRAILER